MMALPPDIPPDLGKHLAGPAGSLAALFWIRGSVPRKCGMFAAGWALSFYGSSAVSAWMGFNEGFTGFLLGLFGMSIVDSIFKSWQDFGLTDILHEFVRARLGLPQKPKGD